MTGPAHHSERGHQTRNTTSISDRDYDGAELRLDLSDSYIEVLDSWLVGICGPKRKESCIQYGF
jgi:hypothetical protein